MVELFELQKNISLCLSNIEAAKKRANRQDSVVLIGATKTQPKELIKMIQDNHLLTDVGENHVQEIVEKYETGDNLTWHMIGQLQSNKVKYIVGKVALIHSLDRESLAQEIDKQAKKHNVIQDCLIEINMGSEITKGGIAKEDLAEFMSVVEKYDNIRIRGLMSVMPNLEDKELLKNMYIDLKALFDNLKNIASLRHKIDTLSCGMTNDYELAVEYGGSTMVRLGRVLFGARN
ncbi:MAG: YggS family pyridoxal phosphate-dependent enzyme [Christensenella sp.]|nr:YggS family pyridoxal phosphate-dependent enzyme [Christensenella sp.]